MKKKILAMCLVVALAMTAIAGATLAYFTDTDAKTNVFTSGDVAIKLIEQQRRDDQDQNHYDPFLGKNHAKLIPYTGEEGTMVLAKNYVDKIVNVENKGSEDAYVRVLVAVPVALKDALHIDWNSKAWSDAKVIGQAMIQDDTQAEKVLCDVYSTTYQKALKPGATTKDQAMWGLYLNPAVDCDRDNDFQYTLNGTPINYNLTAGMQIPVVAQAVQVAGFDTPEAAFEAAYGVGNLTELPEGWDVYPPIA